ncbi:MAG: ATP-binding protein [Candidatus Poribacteria bacterium]
MNIRKPKFNLAIKFGILISVPMLLVSLYVSQSYTMNSLKLIEETMIERADSISKGIALSIEYGLLVENKDILHKSIANYKNEKDILYLSIKNNSGEELVSYSKEQMPTDEEKGLRIDVLKSHAEEENLSEGYEGNHNVSETPLLYDIVCNVTTIREKKSREDIGFLESSTILDSDPSKSEIEKIGTVQIGLSKSNMLYSIHRAKMNAIGLTTGAIVITVFITILLVRIMVRPIKQLALAADRVSNGDFDYPVKTKSKDEIGNLADSFNKMIADLKVSREALQHRLNMERFLATTSTDFINLASDEVEANINRTLKAIGELLGFDQSYVLLLSKDNKRIQITYEWDADGIEQRASDFRDRSIEEFLWGINKTHKFETINIPRVTDLPAEASAEKESLQSYGIQSLLGVPLIYGGKLIGLLGLNSIRSERVWMEDDITQLKMVGQILVNALERKRSEDALQHQLEVEERMSKELEEKTKELSLSNEELNSFVYIVSHDLKAPLVSIQGFSTILSKDYKDQFDDNGKMYVDRIMKNSERMGTLIDNLLELSRIGRIKGKEGTINISNMISEISEEISSQIQEKGTKLIVKGDMPTILGDQTRIKQIFANLISNANKFMGDDNEVPTIEVGYDSQNGCHRFYVKDNGIGIDKQYHNKVFQIFQRLDDIKTEGTGVGLAIVKKIVESFGGNLWLDSEKGKGTTMYFTIPKEDNLESKKEE